MSSKGRSKTKIKAARGSSVPYASTTGSNPSGALVKRQPSFRAVKRSAYSYLTSSGGRAAGAASGWTRQLEAAYASHNGRMVMGYYNSTSAASAASQSGRGGCPEGGYCCDDCSYGNTSSTEAEAEDYVYSGPNNPWPIVPAASVASSRAVVPYKQTPTGSTPGAASASKSSRNRVRRQGSRVYSRSSSGRPKAASSVRRTVTRTITATSTKTLVSLKSCRSLSEVETLPPTGYLVRKATYVNENYASDDDDMEKEEGMCRDICCRQRWDFFCDVQKKRCI